MKALGKLWAIFTAFERRKALGMLALVILMAMAETGGVLSIMPFLSVIARPELIHDNHWLQAIYIAFGFSDKRAFITALGLASIAIVLASSAFKTVTLHLMNRFIHLLRHAISARLLSRYLHQPYEYFLQHNTAALSRNALSEVDQLLFNLIQPLSQLIAQGAVVAAMLLVLFIYSPIIACCLVAVIGLLYAAIYGLVRKRLARIGAERQFANGQRFQSCNEALGGIKDVKITQAADAYQTKFEHASREYSRHMAAGETLAQSPLYMVEAVGYTGLIVIALVLMLQTGDIGQVLPALGLYGFAAYRILPSAQVMYRGFAKLKFSSAALAAIHCDLALPEEQPTTATGVLTPNDAIRLENVSYAYPSTPDKPAVDNFSLTIPVGTSVDIAGPSGAGKSTVMDILLGLLEPQRGQLSVGGVPVTAANVAAWQQAIGYVPQHIFLADTTVAQNIAFGIDPANIHMAAVEHAARAAQLHEFIVGELKHGYDTPLGERGIRLSGGQRQRIGIARALYRDPPVLLMDEATSALDSQTENAFNESIANLAGTKTVVVIAHRLTSLAYCEQVINLGAD